jgi:hypothetical protein
MKLEAKAEACLEEIRNKVLDDTSVDPEDNIEALRYIQETLGIYIESLEHDIQAQNQE